MPLKSAIFLLAALICSGVWAQDYPLRPVVLVVPFAAGGPTDTLARYLASVMSPKLKHQVIVENTAGAGGTIGINKVAKARNDGYTLLLMHVGMSTSPSLYKELPYSALDDFEYIGQVADLPMTLVAKTSLPPDNLIALLQETVKDSTLKSQLAVIGAEPVPVSKANPESLRNQLTSEIGKWAKIIKAAGVPVN